MTDKSMLLDIDDRDGDFHREVRVGVLGGKTYLYASLDNVVNGYVTCTYPLDLRPEEIDQLIEALQEAKAEVEKPKLKPYQERVLAEYDELFERWQKLSAFLDSEKMQDLSEVERSLLHEQYLAMSLYVHFLQKRIDLWVHSVAASEDKDDSQ